MGSSLFTGQGDVLEAIEPRQGRKVSATSVDRSIAEQAAEWVERMKAPSDRDRAEFMRWIKRSPLHVREVLLAITVDAELTGIDPDHKIDVDELIAESESNVAWIGEREGMGSHAMRRLRARWPLFAGVGVAAVLLLVVGWFIGATSFPYRNDYRTAVGEQRVVELRDGSVIHLNTQSRLRVDLSRNARDVYFREGQATFKIEHDPARPFRVHVDEAVIEATGTQFDVHRRADRVTIAVIEGQVEIAASTSAGVEVTSAASRTRLSAGEATTIMPDRQITAPEPVSLADITAWQRRQLIFRMNTLDEIATEFNRYNRTPKIRVEGDALQKRVFVLVRLYDADNPESLLDFLSAEEDIEVVRQGDVATIRWRHPASLQAQ